MRGFISAAPSTLSCKVSFCIPTISHFPRENDKNTIIYYITFFLLLHFLIDSTSEFWIRVRLFLLWQRKTHNLYRDGILKCLHQSRMLTLTSVAMKRKYAEMLIAVPYFNLRFDGCVDFILQCQNVKSRLCLNNGWIFGPSLYFMRQPI